MATSPQEPPRPEGLWTLGYVSVAVRLPRPQEVQHILEASHRDNPGLGVTGLLVHCDGTFMQVLEGPRDGVEEIFRRIRAHPLHTSIQVLFEERIDAREFGDWAMLCKEVCGDTLQPLLRAPAGSKRKMISEYWRAWS